jgi:hypothetical protein
VNPLPQPEAGALPPRELPSTFTAPRRRVTRAEAQAGHSTFTPPVYAEMESLTVKALPQSWHR